MFYYEVTDNVESINDKQMSVIAQHTFGWVLYICIYVLYIYVYMMIYMMYMMMIYMMMYLCTSQVRRCYLLMLSC